jgi:hypothetical protein
MPFAKTIKARNADFFLKYPFTEYEKDETIIPVIRKMKDMSLQISPVNQSHIMDYVNNLLTMVEILRNVLKPIEVLRRQLHWPSGPCVRVLEVSKQNLVDFRRRPLAIQTRICHHHFLIIK